MNENMHNNTQLIFLAFLPKPTCSCTWDLIYMHQMHGKYENSLKIAYETQNALENQN